MWNENLIIISAIHLWGTAPRLTTAGMSRARGAQSGAAGDSTNLIPVVKRCGSFEWERNSFPIPYELVYSELSQNFVMGFQSAGQADSCHSVLCPLTLQWHTYLCSTGKPFLNNKSAFPNLSPPLSPSKNFCGFVLHCLTPEDLFFPSVAWKTQAQQEKLINRADSYSAIKWTKLNSTRDLHS